MSEKRNNIVLTGCGAMQRLLVLADTVSEEFAIKHALTDGVSVQEGGGF